MGHTNFLHCCCLAAECDELVILGAITPLLGCISIHGDSHPSRGTRQWCCSQVSSGVASAQEVNARSSQHVEALRLKVHELRETLVLTKRELKRNKKALSTLEVSALQRRSAM